MTCKRGLRIAGHVLALTPFKLLGCERRLGRRYPVSRASSGAVRSMRVMNRAMASNTGNPLWNPSLGIRFSPSPEPKSKPKALYPRLDVSRFLHVAGSGSSSASDLLLEANAAHDIYPSEKELPNGQSVMEAQAALLLADTTVKGGASMETPDDITGEKDKRKVNGEGVESNKKQSKDPEPVDPPRTPLSFNISTDLFYAARAAAAGTPDSFWSHTMYQRITSTGAVERVKVHYCTSKHTIEYVCKRHFLGEPVLGLDLEWLPYASRGSSTRENVSLIQVASPGRVGLFHVAMFAKGDDLVAPTFRSIMGDPAVSKVGVHIQGDCTRLSKYLGVKARGVFELSHLYKLVKFAVAGTPRLINKVPVALSTQVEELLRLPLYKGDSVRSSNWMRPLNARQLHADSASDAYAGIQLYHVLEAKRMEIKPVPPRPHHAELGLSIPIPEPEPETSEVSDEGASTELDTPAKPTQTPKKAKAAATPKAAKSPRPAPKSRDARVTTAELQTKEYRAAKQTPVSASPAALRAYYIWHANEDLAPESVAKLLRDPPLQINTVVSYILDAITAEKMPYGKARLKAEVIPHLHPNLVSGRYRYLARACENIELPKETS
ncbi:Werner syndrome ATP-dependent helicase [Tolypocladium ophioglossoides CBS 100239]|uniref:Werner syndrome ATP-dependent helicase n=1 Tax=Tolypocladium ophioglossoides (strain CBS 100239) TaxID=1163406 RepID=A0A0L0NH02_TOLOC|nr:Werner syndrome ATP-dependent helicase [Tolypocladium ophioglossoides CBS 100239]